MINVPPVPYQTSMLDKNGHLTMPWLAWFRQLFSRVGGNDGILMTNPMTTLGDTIYAQGSGIAARLPGDTSDIRKFLRQLSQDGVATEPTWDTISLSDIELALSETPLPASSGGTGVDAIPTAPIASSFAAWDANKNFSSNAFISGLTSTATAASITVMTIASTEIQIWTGSTTQTVKLPSTGVVAGQKYFFVNNSTGAVTVQSSGGNTIQALAGNSFAIFTALTSAPTTAAGWNVSYVNNSGASSNGMTTPLTLGTNLTTQANYCTTWPNITIPNGIILTVVNASIFQGVGAVTVASGGTLQVNSGGIVQID